MRTGVFTADGREYPTERDVRAAMEAAAQLRVCIEFLDADGRRVTTIAHPFPAAVAATITGVRLIADEPEAEGAGHASTR